MTNPDELERLARAATPGPWKACGTIYEHMNCEIRSGAKGEGQAIAQFWDGPNAFADGQFAAAANPATILDLLAANRKMRITLETIANNSPAGARLSYSSLSKIARSALSTKETGQ